MQTISRQIEEGTLRTGERVPSVRQISQQEHVSVSTVLQAYGLLESMGYIEARPQSGYYVRRRPQAVRPLPQISAPRKQPCWVGISELMENARRASLMPGVFPLGCPYPAPELLPLKQLNKILVSLAHGEDARAQGISPPPGSLELRRQIARRSFDWDGDLSPEEVVITCGATEALQLALLAVTEPGDLVAIESPAYCGSLLLLENLGRKAVEIASHPQNGICLDVLEEAIKKNPLKACIVSPNFSNPTGSCMPDEAKKKLVELLTSRSIPLIEDDAYGDLYFGEQRPRKAKAFDTEGMVLLCSTFSKAVAPSYRIGWIAAGLFQKRIEMLQMTSTMAVPKLLQMVLAEFITSASYDRHIRRLRSALSLQSQQMMAALYRYFPDEARITRPAGGSFLWVELPAKVDSLKLTESALRHGISISPGPMFSAKQRYRNYIRIGSGLPWTEATEKAAATVGKLIGVS